MDGKLTPFDDPRSGDHEARLAPRPDAFESVRSETKPAFVLQESTPAPQGETRKWKFGSGGGDRTKLGYWAGDIREAYEFDIWVNPENTFMEMARIHDASISGIVRYLGANWTNNNSDSDDYIFRALLNEVARRWGVERPVRDGSVFVTPAGRLTRSHKVWKVAHVACVRPIDADQPGSGYTAVPDVGACMRNLLRTIGGVGDVKGKRMLVPLFSGGSDPQSRRAASDIIARAAAEYLDANPSYPLREVMFLAYTVDDMKLWSQALDALDFLKSQS